MRVPQQNQTRAIDLQLTPMIDVVFLLLIFFLWTSSFERPEFDLVSALSLPPVGGANAQPPDASLPLDEIVIRVFAGVQGETFIQLNQQPIKDVPTLKEKLVAITALQAQPSVIVDPDDNVTMETAITIYDTARAAGFDRVLFAAPQ